MVRVQRTTWSNGKVQKVFLVLNENEWRVIQFAIDKDGFVGNAKLELVDDSDNPAVLKEIEPDDKPKLEEYEVIRIKGEKHFKAEEYEKALYYFEKAYAIRDSFWLKGRVNKCKSILNPKKDDNSSKPKRRGRPPRKK